jgi:hypothetical protein
MFHVKLLCPIGGAKALLASYIRRLETGGNARKNSAIARKSATRPQLRGEAAKDPARPRPSAPA